MKVTIVSKGMKRKILCELIDDDIMHKKRCERSEGRMEEISTSPEI